MVDRPMIGEVHARAPGDDARLAVVLRSAQWALDDLAHDLPAGRATPERLDDLATVLEQLVGLLRARSGIVPGDVVDS